ncbi:element excision factor XisI family protein [Nostoc sp.]|uniref:element excision factor XisI family protein n=1 Tax=Nostoc sp. TaxID=1180 RepID=UPI002FF506D7
MLNEYAQLPYAYGELERQLIIDQTANHYLLLTLGWENNQRVHGCLVPRSGAIHELPLRRKSFFSAIVCVSPIHFSLFG